MSRRAIAAALIGGLVAALLNAIPVVLYHGVSVHLGSVVAMAIATIFGGPAGALASLLSLAPSLASGSDLSVVLFAIAAVFTVGVCARRRVVPTVAALGFIVTAGPLAFVLLQFTHDQSALSTRPVITGLVLDAIIGAMCAELLLTVQPIRNLITGKRSPERQAPLRVHLFRAFAAVSAIPLLVLGVVAGRAYARQLESIAARRLNDAAGTLSAQIDDYVVRHRGTVVALTKDIEHERRYLAGAGDADLLDEYHAAHGDFITLVVTDADGTIVTADRGAAGRAMHAIGQSVADRPYYRVPMATGQAFVSRVFREPGLGNYPIVAVSAPLHDRSGRVVGVVEGSLDASRFARFELSTARLRSSQLYVVDDSSRVVFSALSADALPLAPLDTSTGSDRLVGSAASAFMGWRVLLTQPLAPVRHDAETFFATVMLATVGVIALSIVVASMLARGLTTPIEQLARSVRAFGKDHEPLADLATLSSAPREIATLVEDVRTLTCDVVAASRAREESLAKQDRANKDLTELLAHLDELVQDRTRELKLATARAEDANEAKSRFLATMSHELRTPMHGLIGMLRLLEGENLTDEQHSHLAVVRQSADTLLELLNDLLDHAKIEAGKLVLENADFDPLSLAREVVRLMSAKASQRAVTLDLSVGGSLPTRVRGDAARTRQILLNLVDNAVKFTEGGTVDVRLSPSSGDDDPNAIHFAVSDTGIGMSSEQAARIFQPFTQADASTTRRFGGTGLGLAICRDLVELMGGQLCVDTAPGRGSTFRFTLRFGAATEEEPSDQPPNGASQPAEASRLLTGRVLVVDDHPINRLVAEATLVRQGITVRTAASGEEALAILADERFDVVFMDCRMPEMDGFETTRLLREREQTGTGTRTPVVALTAGASPAEQEQCRIADMDDFLAKPLAEAELARVLERWLGASSRSGELGSNEGADAQGMEAVDCKMLDSLRAAFVVTPGGFEDFVIMLYGVLMIELPALWELIEVGEMRPIAAAAHRLAGVTLQAGARRLGDALIAMEAAAYTGNAAEVRTHAATTCAESKRALEALDMYLALRDRASAA